MATILFDELLRSMAAAVADTNRFLQQSQGDMEHFEAHPEDGFLRPRTMKMVLPRQHIAPGEGAEGVHEVPTATLAHHHHLLMDRLAVDFQCQIDGVASDQQGGRPKLALVLGGKTSQDPRHLATVKISFRCTEPPEGTARVRDQLLKKF